MAFAIRYEQEALDSLKRLRRFDAVRIVDEIEKHLADAPSTESVKRKRISGPDGERVWQLRVGDYRVFYDVDEEEEEVVVRLVRFKGRSTTEEAL